MYKALFLSLVFLLFNRFANGQLRVESHKTHYDLPKQLLLVNLMSRYVYASSQGQIDLDSALLIACKTYKVHHLLPYMEEYEVLALPGATLIQAGKIKEAETLLNNLPEADRLKLLLQLGANYLFMPGTKPSDMNKALHYLRTAGELSNLVKLPQWQQESRSLLGKYYYQAGDITQSQKYFVSVVAAYRQANNEAKLALALENQGTYLPFNHPEKLALLHQALTLYQKLRNKEKEIDVLSKIVTEKFSTDWDATEKDLYKLLKLQQAIGFRHLHYTQIVLGYIADHKGDYVQALSFYQQAIKSMEATNDTILASTFYMRMGMYHMNLNETEEAITYFRKSLKNKSKQTQLFWYKSFFSVAWYLANLNQDQKALDLIAEITKEYPPLTIFEKMHVASLKALCYEHLGKTQLAEQNYQLFTILADKFPPEHLHAEAPEAYFNAASFYYKRNQPDKAKQYLLKAQNLSVGKTALNNLIQINKLFFKLDSAAGNYPAAIKHYQLFKFYSDSANNLNQKKHLDALLVQHQAEKKDRDIKWLTQQGRMQQSNLYQANVTKNVTFAGIMLLAIILILLYHQYRVKQRSNLQINQKNNYLQQLVQEKEWLLKEIHHRVKNNLHTVTSLLESQSAYLKDDALLAIQNSQHRVFAMSLIHQRLYQSENMATIDMSLYMRELVNYLQDSFNIRQRIYFQLQLEPVELDVSQAVPLGLILNEAITNSVKYAFPNNRECKISISIAESEEKQLLLSITDNGIGLPPDFQAKEISSLGIRLMRGLSEDLGGQLSISSREGTRISVIFPIDRTLQNIQKTTTKELVMI